MMTLPFPDPLPSWNDGPAKQSILRFVGAVTVKGSPDYVPPAERIAAFDSDGTICAEMPVPIQFAFTAHRVRARAPDHPDWNSRSPFREILAGDMIGTLASGMGAFSQVLAASYAGMTTDEFEREVTAWIGTDRHPVTGLPYTAMVYRPMIELIRHLRDNRFRVYLVTASGIDFLRPWVEEAFGIPREQVIGSNIRLKNEETGSGPALVRLPLLELYDEGGEKPAAFHHFTGRRPIFAFGNTDGDLPMLRWVASGNRPSFAGLIHHTDPVREWAYEAYHPVLPIGRLDHGLAIARNEGWTVVDMASDWKTIFPFGAVR